MFPIVGMRHTARGPEWARSQPGTPFLLSIDHTNPHDANAVAAFSIEADGSFKHVGYVAAYMAKECRDRIAASGRDCLNVTLDFNEDGAPLACVG